MANIVYPFHLLFPLAALLAACTPSDSMETKALCENLQKIDWRDSEQWRRAINVIPFQRVVPIHEGDNYEAMNSVIDQLDRLIKPAKMSEQLKSGLLKIDKADFTYAHPAKTSFYFFGNTQGSAHCRYDIWAVENETILDPIDQPFHNDDCGASIHFGNFGGRPLILQIQYAPDMPLVEAAPSTIEAVFGNPDDWDEICKFDLELR